jgi:hypothetical protein
MNEGPANPKKSRVSLKVQTDWFERSALKTKPEKGSTPTYFFA